MLEPSRIETDDQGPKLVSWGSLKDSALAEIERRHNAKQTGRPLGPECPFPTLNEILSGHFAKGLHVISGAPGTGKSALAWQIASDCKAPAIFISCELSPMELLFRMLARSSGVFYSRFKNGELTRAQVDGFIQQCAFIRDDLFIADARSHYVKAEWVTRKIINLRESSKATNPDGHVLAVVDSLHSWSEQSPDGTTEYERLGSAVQHLTAAAADADAAILAISEQNREAMKSEANGKSGGGLHSGAGSRKIEFGPETVITMTRDMDSPADARGYYPVVAKVVKNRHGEAGKFVDFGFHGGKQEFFEKGAK